MHALIKSLKKNIWETEVNKESCENNSASHFRLIGLDCKLICIRLFTRWL